MTSPAEALARGRAGPAALRPHPSGSQGPRAPAAARAEGGGAPRSASPSAAGRGVASVQTRAGNRWRGAPDGRTMDAARADGAADRWCSRSGPPA